MRKTSSIWYILMFVSIWNHPEHISYVFRHFWLDFMLFLTSKLLKNVNFGLLDHFGQLVLTTCVWYDQIHLGACKYLSEVPSTPISCPEMQNISWGVKKTIFFSPTPGWWNNHLQLVFFWRGWFFIKARLNYPKIKHIPTDLFCVGTQNFASCRNILRSDLSQYIEKHVNFMWMKGELVK